LIGRREILGAPNFINPSLLNTTNFCTSIEIITLKPRVDGAGKCNCHPNTLNPELTQRIQKKSATEPLKGRYGKPSMCPTDGKRGGKGQKGTATIGNKTGMILQRRQRTIKKMYPRKGQRRGTRNPISWGGMFRRRLKKNRFQGGYKDTRVKILGIQRRTKW